MNQAKTENSLRAYLNARDICDEDQAAIVESWKTLGYWVSPDGATSFGVPPLGEDPRWAGAYRVREPEVVNRETEIQTR